MKTGVCPACYADDKKLSGHKNNFDVFICQGCQTLFVTTLDGNTKYNYENYYTEHNTYVPEFVQQRITEIVDGFAKYRQNNFLLDVGCGAGTLLRAATKAGWQAQGVEVSSSSIEALQQQNIKVFYGYLAEAEYAAASFDVVTAVEVLEHIPDPEVVIAEIYRVLRPGGLFYATTPHARGLSGRLLGAKWTCVAPPEHLHLFSVKGIKTLMRKANFREVRVLTQGVNPFEIFHAFRYGQVAESHEENFKPSFDRVSTAYGLNASLTRSVSRRTLKNLINSTLNFSRLGDSLKIWAVK